MPRREEIQPSAQTDPHSYYTEAVRYGNLVFVSGQVALDSDGEVVGEGDVAAQANRALENLGRVLDAAGASPAYVLKITIFMTNAADRARIMPARRAFFGATRPASTLVEVRALARPELLIEIEAIAAVPDSGAP
jgi:2-iminobutanoate/2-iminopropanoate deaminase